MGALVRLLDDTCARLTLTGDCGNAVPVMKLPPTLGVTLDRSGTALKGTYSLTAADPVDDTGARLSNMFQGSRKCDRTSVMCAELYLNSWLEMLCCSELKLLECDMPRRMHVFVAGMYSAH